MNTEMLTDHIRGVRQRLADLQEKRAIIARTTAVGKADLTAEEMTLEALLVQLRDRATKGMDATLRRAYPDPWHSGTGAEQVAQNGSIRCGSFESWSGPFSAAREPRLEVAVRFLGTVGDEVRAERFLDLKSITQEVCASSSLTEISVSQKSRVLNGAL